MRNLIYKLIYLTIALQSVSNLYAMEVFDCPQNSHQQTANIVPISSLSNLSSTIHQHHIPHELFGTIYGKSFMSLDEKEKLSGMLSTKHKPASAAMRYATVRMFHPDKDFFGLHAVVTKDPNNFGKFILITNEHLRDAFCETDDDSVHAKFVNINDKKRIPTIKLSCKEAVYNEEEDLMLWQLGDLAQPEFTQIHKQPVSILPIPKGRGKMEEIDTFCLLSTSSEGETHENSHYSDDFLQLYSNANVGCSGSGAFTNGDELRAVLVGFGWYYRDSIYIPLNQTKLNWMASVVPANASGYELYLDSGNETVSSFGRPNLLEAGNRPNLQDGGNRADLQNDDKEIDLKKPTIQSSLGYVSGFPIRSSVHGKSILRPNLLGHRPASLLLKLPKDLVVVSTHSQNANLPLMQQTRKMNRGFSCHDYLRNKVDFPSNEWPNSYDFRHFLQPRFVKSTEYATIANGKIVRSTPKPEKDNYFASIVGSPHEIVQNVAIGTIDPSSKKTMQSALTQDDWLVQLGPGKIFIKDLHMSKEWIHLNDENLCRRVFVIQNPDTAEVVLYNIDLEFNISQEPARLHIPSKENGFIRVDNISRLQFIVRRVRAKSMSDLLRGNLEHFSFFDTIWTDKPNAKPEAEIVK